MEPLLKRGGVLFTHWVVVAVLVLGGILSMGLLMTLWLGSAIEKFSLAHMDDGV